LEASGVRTNSNRLIAMKRRIDDFTVVATFKYDGVHRRNSKAIVNSGVETTLGDSGDTTENNYRSGGRVIQIGNGSQGLVEGAAFNQQIVWGPGGCDPVLIDIYANQGHGPAVNARFSAIRPSIRAGVAGCPCIRRS